MATGTKPRILVTGSETPAGLAAVRALDQAGFEVWAAVESRTAMGARSRAAAGLVDVGDPRVDPDGFVFERENPGPYEGWSPAGAPVHAVFSIRDPRPSLVVLEDVLAALRRRVRGTRGRYP